MAILDKIELARYIAAKYQNDYHTDISPIKLQKGLYFLYAMWGGKIADAQLDGVDTEDDGKYAAYDKYLFNASFEAWRYGPVDREIYNDFDQLISNCQENTSLFNSSNVSYIDDVKGYIDSLLDKIFRTNDFVLVDLSHEDVCWKQAIKQGINTPIANDDIIREYQS